MFNSAWEQGFLKSFPKSAFANYADFVVVPIRVGVVSLTIKPFEKYEASSREIALSFLNYALDLAANYHLEREK